jgi:hypothetical protein
MPFTQLFAIPHIVNPQPVYAPAIVKKTDIILEGFSRPISHLFRTASVTHSKYSFFR